MSDESMRHCFNSDCARLINTFSLSQSNFIMSKVTKVSFNEKFSIQVKGKQPKDFKKLKKFLFDFLNFQTK